MGIISGLRDMIIKRFLLIVAAAVSVFVVVIILAAAAAAGNGISQHTCYICKTVYLPHTHTYIESTHKDIFGRTLIVHITREAAQKKFPGAKLIIS